VVSTLPPASAARSTVTEPGRMLSTMSRVTSTGARRPGTSAVVMMMSTWPRAARDLVSPAAARAHFVVPLGARGQAAAAERSAESLCGFQMRRRRRQARHPAAWAGYAEKGPSPEHLHKTYNH